MNIVLLDLDTILVLVVTVYSLQIFPIPSPWRVSYIIYLPSGNLSPPFVDRLVHHLSVCPIAHLPKPLVSCDSQDNIVKGFSPHKCSQEVWWDALNVGATTILPVMSRLTPFPNLFLYNMTFPSNVDRKSVV